MAFGIPDPEEEARRQMLRRGEDQLSGSTSPWPTSSPLYPEQPPLPQGEPRGSNRAAAAEWSALQPMARPATATRSKMWLSWTALLLGLGGSGMTGIGVYAALATIEFSAHPFAASSGWLSMAAVGLVVILIALLAAVIALFVSRPKLVATLALLIGLVAPWMSAIIAGKLGADTFGRHASEALGGHADNIGEILIELMVMTGIDPEPYRRLIEILFGG